MKKPEKKICGTCKNKGQFFLESMGEWYPCSDCNLIENRIFNATCETWEKYTKALEERLEMAEEKARELYQQKWDIINGLPSEKEIADIIKNTHKISKKQCYAGYLAVHNYSDIAKVINKRNTGFKFKK